MSEQTNQLNENDFQDKPEGLDTPMKILSFCIPLAGAIIYFINKDKAPQKSKDACTMALIGMGVGIVFQVIAYMIKGNN